jgi:hypothetical protein
MRRKPLLGLLAILLLAPAACGVIGGPAEDTPETDGAVVEESASTATGESDAAADDAAVADASGTALATGEAGAEEDLAPAATLSPEEVSLIENFRPPSKGSDDALVTIYEFSDYI